MRGVSRLLYLSIRLLPGPLRRPVGLAYLLARASDTVADTAELPAGDRAALLLALAGAIASDAPDAAALQRLATEFAPLQRDGDERGLLLALPRCLDQLQSLPGPDRADIRTVLRHITRGQSLDVERFGAAGPCRALASAAELEEYTYLVAGCVGEFWTDLCQRHLPGFANLPVPRMRELGRAYGCGLQLVNILRDAPADLAAGRCYLPADELAGAGWSAPAVAREPERLFPVWQPWLARADAQLSQGMHYADAVNSRRVRAASALPALLGARTLALLRDSGAQALTHSVKMPRAEVRSVLLRLATTLAGRASLRAQFARLQRGTVIGGMGQSRAMTPQQYVQDKAAASGSSFYYAFLFLPPPRRAAITAFYAFCREVDDVVDEVSDPGIAQTKLAWWQAEVAQAFAGRPSHPVMQALMPCVPEFGLQQAQLQAVIEGCRMDLEQTRYLDFPGLERYCHLVAGVVGEVSARIFGQSEEATTRYAHTLGLAFQLTNIIRDVGEDAMRGRIYLPVDELQRFDVKAHEVLNRKYSDRFTALMKFQAERAHRLYDEALAQLPPNDRRAQKPGLMMASIYRTLLREIEQDGFQVLHQRIALTPLRKLWLAWKVQALGRM